MSESMYPQATRELAERRRALAPDAEAAFRQFSQAVFRAGALPEKTKQLIAVAVRTSPRAPIASAATPKRPCARGHRRRS